MNKSKLLYPELSYQLAGLCFKVQNTLGRFAKEKQYCDFFETKLLNASIEYKRELLIPRIGNRIDFLIENVIIIEVKAKPFLIKDDCYQLQRYLSIMDLELGLLVNFTSRYLKPQRVLRPFRSIRDI